MNQKIKNNIIFICISIMVLSVSIVHSEPSKSVKYLMDEPVSMFEWGLFQLDNDITEECRDFIKFLIEEEMCYPPNYKSYDEFFETETYYLYDSNQIFIKIYFDTYFKSGYQSSKKNIVFFIESFLDVFLKRKLFRTTYSDENMKKEDGIKKYFNSYPFVKSINNSHGKLPEDIFPMIENIVNLEVTVTNHSKSWIPFSKTKTRRIIYKCPLIGDDIRIEEEFVER